MSIRNQVETEIRIQERLLRIASSDYRRRLGVFLEWLVCI
jgi:hypothetical protein